MYEIWCCLLNQILFWWRVHSSLVSWLLMSFFLLLSPVLVFLASLPFSVLHFSLMLKWIYSWPGEKGQVCPDIQGPAGKPGRRGEDGAPGKSRTWLSGLITFYNINWYYLNNIIIQNICFLLLFIPKDINMKIISRALIQHQIQCFVYPVDISVMSFCFQDRLVLQEPKVKQGTTVFKDQRVNRLAQRSDNL